MNLSSFLKTTSWLLWAALLTAQDFNVKSKTDFIDVVEPIITKGEREIYQKLPDQDARRYFQSIFWYKRDEDPQTSENAYRRTFFERRQIALAQFSEQNKSGEQTDRGRIFILLGDPEEVTQRRLDAGLRSGYEEVWHYPSRNLEFRFIYDGRGSGYELQDRAGWEKKLEEVRDQQVLDRAEPYRMTSIPLTLPNLGFTKDIEHLAADDRRQIDFDVRYQLLGGGDNQTEILVGIRFNDASGRGIDLNLAAFNPYKHKELDFKKRIAGTNGTWEFFTVVLEHDQYDMVMRIKDRDDRESIQRTRLNVPAIHSLPSASDLFLAGGLQRIPLQGFDADKRFAFDRLYFPLGEDDFSQAERLYVLQFFYQVDSLPEPTFFLNGRQVSARLEQSGKVEHGYRGVWSLPKPTGTGGQFYLRSSYRLPGRTEVKEFFSQPFNSASHPSLVGAEAGSVEIAQPSDLNLINLNRVVVKPAENLTVKKVTVFLNNDAVLEMTQPPWMSDFPEGIAAVSGEYTLTALVEAEQGVYKVSKTLTPQRIDDGVQTRLVQVYFNAYDADLKFVSDLDFDKIEVIADGNKVKPQEVEKVDEPITYCFLIDHSYSMRETFNGNMRAVKKMIQSMRPQDKGYFVTFSDKYTQYLQPNQSKAVLEAVLDTIHLQNPNPRYTDKFYEENQTYLYDAAIAAIHSLLQYPGRKVIVLVTDGIGSEAFYTRNGLLNYAQANEVVIYSLWLDNNPGLSDDEVAFLQKEMGGGEKLARTIGLSRFFGKKDARKNYIRGKVQRGAITEGVVEMLAEESGGFHYRIFRADRSVVASYVRDIEEAVQNQFRMTLSLPVSLKTQELEVTYGDPNVEIRSKSKIRVRKTNPLVD